MDNLKLSEQQLQAVQEYSAHGFTLCEIAIAIAVEPYDFLIANGIDAATAKAATMYLTQMTEVRKAVYKGRLEAQYKLRLSTMKQAIAGSTPAQAEMRRYLAQKEV